VWRQPGQLYLTRHLVVRPGLSAVNAFGTDWADCI